MYQGAPADNDADDTPMSADNDADDTPIQRRQRCWWHPHERWQTPTNDTDSRAKQYGYTPQMLRFPLTAAFDDDDSADSGVIY